MIRVHDLREVHQDLAEAWLVQIARDLRKSDRDEIAAMSRLDPVDAMLVSYWASSHAFLIKDRDHQPIAAFGAAPHPLPGVGVVWMLGTDGIRREAVGIAKETRRYFDELNAAYGILWNYIDARNEVSLRWLRWGGFKLLGDTAMGPEAHPFHIFARTNLNV